MTEELPKQYVHSVKVPQKFKTAAKFISNAIKQGISLKTQIYNQKHEVFAINKLTVFSKKAFN